jgi:hypothetical protein
MVEHLYSKHEALGSIPSTPENRNEVYLLISHYSARPLGFSNPPILNIQNPTLPAPGYL